MLVAYLKKFPVHFEYTVEEFKHFMMPREDVIFSFVVEDPETKNITDFFSFYYLPSSILRHEEHKLLKVAYSYYNVPGKHTIKEIMRDAIVIAKQKDMDVFNALDIMENGQVLEDLKFGVGDGHLHYYLYNWRIRELEAKDIGIVLV